MSKIVFDVETNGLHGSSVLSFSCLILNKNNEVIKEVERYYFREKDERINPKATVLNGLTDAVIKEKRKDVGYVEYFRDDEYINGLFKNADEIIAHNISFNISFLNESVNLDTKKIVCTMEETQYLYDAPYMMYGEPKFPQLSESARHFGIKIDSEKLHNSLYDCHLCFEIYKKL